MHVEVGFSKARKSRKHEKPRAGYYLAVKEICDERGYDAVSLKDVDGMKSF